MNNNTPKPKLKALVGGAEKVFKGRPAWTLGKLVAAGGRGISSLDLPAGVRLSHYILQLRKNGVPVETKYEKHGGEFAGEHARYRLAAPVSILETEAA